MPRSRPRRTRTRAEWETLVAEWRASGQSQQAFATRKGIATTTLSWWSCRLRREAQGRAPAAGLVPVRVVDVEAPAAGFVLRLRGGVEVAVPASFDADALRRLVDVFEAGAC